VLLPDDKLREVAVSMFNLSRMLVYALCLEPLLRPISQIESIIGTRFVKASLHATHEVSQLGILPSELTEVNLKTFAKDLPAHQEDQLFDHAGAFAVRNTVNQ